MNKSLYFSFSVALVLAGTASTAAAQAVSDPDIRNVRPVVMLLVDTSGSMSRMSGGSDAALPRCAGSTRGTNDRNRWTQTVEALTGTWNDTDYYCSTRDRSTLSSFSPDYNYYLPYHQLPAAASQNSNGILDVYLDRIKFGLMTFDATYTFSDAHPLLVRESVFGTRLGDNAALRGGFSYGGGELLRYPSCDGRFMVDSGARNEDAPAGALIPVAITEVDVDATNQDIQSQLLAVRPFGGTPTAALLTDFGYYLGHHSSVTTDDPYQACRPRFAILLTDGQPDEDFRDDRFRCDRPGGDCPYETSANIARELCLYDGTGCTTGIIDGLYVVAFDVGDSDALDELNLIAARGGTVAALRAGDRDELMRRISDVLDRTAPGNTTRSRPAFVSGGSTFSSGGVPTQYEFHAGFQVGDSETPWTGVLERARFLCTGLTPEAEPVEDRVQFHEVLNARGTPRRLLTVVTPNAADMEGNLIGTQAASVPLGAGSPSAAVTDQVLVNFATGTGSLTPDYFGIAGGSPTDRTARRDHIINWVHGTTDDRRDARLGDIYHSSPVAVGAPRTDIADESYNEFRRLPNVVNRPTVVYVGTNDGVLHAFVAEDFTDPSTGDTFDAGHELWGFIPPIMVPKLESATVSHQIMVDGTPLIRDVFYRRQPGDQPNGSIYHTVLLMGFRAGAPGYFALDVTNPLEPEFLWQYVGEQPTGHGMGSARRVTPLGFSYGTPALGQVLVDIGGTLQERAIALLPGGSGSVDEEDRRTTGPVGCPAQGIGQPPVTDGTTNARSRQRCWNNTGRILTWVDVVTGEIIREFDESVFNAPLTGGVALAPGEIGQTAERAFLTDADGVMWAVDFSSRRTSDWSVRPFHDIFWDDEATVGQPAYSPPLITSDSEGRFVVVQSTGDIDRLDATSANRVVSLTEQVSYGAGGAPTYTTELNWEIRLHDGEQVTGPLELFEGSVYFGSFESNSDPSTACDIGGSRMWAVDYLASGATPPTGYLDVVGGAFPEPRFEGSPGVFSDHIRELGGDSLILGVGITQRPTCLSGADEFDPYIGSRYRVGDVAGGAFTLTAQVSGGATDASAGAIRTIEVPLPSPQSFTTMESFAGSVEY